MRTLVLNIVTLGRASESCMDDGRLTMALPAHDSCVVVMVIRTRQCDRLQNHCLPRPPPSDWRKVCSPRDGKRNAVLSCKLFFGVGNLFDVICRNWFDGTCGVASGLDRLVHRRVRGALRILRSWGQWDWWGPREAATGVSEAEHTRGSRPVDCNEPGLFFCFCSWPR